MTELKALGKEPPIEHCFCFEDREPECHHGCNVLLKYYCQALLEAADELEKRCPKRYRKVHTEEDEKICCWCGLAKKLRTSAGVE